MRLPVNKLALTALVFLASLGNAPPGAGDRSDYPVVLGDLFTVDGKTFTPIDAMNYDAVGRATVAAAPQGTAISAANRTLPLPSYAEITSLVSGRTILVRVERRGPMTGDALVELSPGAAAQLGIDGRSAVRVRRVNPPEPERALLRVGQTAPLRLETPKGLLAALQRKLALQDGAPGPLLPIPILAPIVKPGPKPALVKPTPVEKPAAAQIAPTAKPVTSTKPLFAAKRTTVTPTGSLVVQVGAFSVRSRAQDVAVKSGGAVENAGKLYRVRIGPFATQAQAAAALAKARAAGYADARIQRAN